MQNDRMARGDDEGVDVTADSPLPDIPDAGDGSQPITSPDPLDFSTATINTDSALVAGTLDDGDPRTLYEQALDAHEEAGDVMTPDTRLDGSQTGGAVDADTPDTRRSRIYDALS
jgi:hypothetical protein